MKLKYKYLSISLPVALVPLVVAMGISLWHTHRISHSLTMDTVQARLFFSAERISCFFRARGCEIHSYAASPLLRSMNWTRIRPFLMSELKKHNNIYEKFILGDREARFYNTAGGNPYFGGLRTFNDRSPATSPRSIRNRTYWQYTVGANRNSDMRLYISDPMISYTTGVTQVVIASSILSRNSTVGGMLGGTVSWDKIESLVNNARNRFIKDYGDTARLFMVSHTGTYVYHWDSSKIVRIMHDHEGDKILNEIGEKKTVSHRITDEPVAELSSAGNKMVQGKSGFSRYRDPESGLSMFIVYAPVKSANYSMALVIPESTVLRPVRDLLWALGGILCASVLLILVLAPISAEKISTPITRLSEAVKKFTLTGEKTEIPGQGLNYEIDFLTHNTLKMMDTICEREKSLLKSEELYRELIENITDTIFIMDPEGRITYASPVVLEVYGYTADEVIGTNFASYIIEEDLPVLIQELEDLKSGTLKPAEFRVHDRSGNIRWVRSSSRPVFTGGLITEIHGIISDITHEKIAVEGLRTSLQEKEILLRELYHRTKNNMQVIYSLLSLQADRITDKSTRDVLEITGNRIMAMALVHQKLYQSVSLSKINLAEYISEFVHLLIDSHQPEFEVMLDLELEPVQVLIDTAIPCGLVLNELLTNSFKHAFTDMKQGLISISLKKFNEKGIQIICRDNGKGVAEDFDFRNSGGLGFQIVYSIVEHQLQGTVFTEVSNGMSCTVTFTDQLYRERV